ncbi:hypothetical protein HYZ05_00725, partial [Candidatus Daviesbacteria bacterium]|nr:hypothetical protein [Candidatus Daviesbacteria bacterium]
MKKQLFFKWEISFGQNSPLGLFCQMIERAGHIGNTSKSMAKEEFIDKFIARLNFVGSATEQEMTKIASGASE